MRSWVKGLKGDIVQLNDALFYFVSGGCQNQQASLFTGLSPKTVHTLKLRIRTTMREGREKVIYGQISDFFSKKRLRKKIPVKKSFVLAIKYN